MRNPTIVISDTSATALFWTTEHSSQGHSFPFREDYSRKTAIRKAKRELIDRGFAEAEIVMTTRPLISLVFPD